LLGRGGGSEAAAALATVPELALPGGLLRDALTEFLKEHDLLKLTFLPSMVEEYQVTDVGV
jgi:hypothetical protein